MAAPHETSAAVLVEGQLSSFSRLCGLPPSTSLLVRRCLSLLTSESLDRPLAPRYDGLSRINANGFPFQWSLSLGDQPPAVRFLCEAGPPGGTVASRATLSLDKVRSLARLLSFEPPEWLYRAVAPRVIPLTVPDRWRSAVWLALGASGSAIVPKAYFNINGGPILDRWKTLGWILKDLGRERSLESLCEISPTVSGGSLPVGVAFDLTPDGGPGRVKVYFRSTGGETELLERWYRACGARAHEEAVRSFLDCFPPDGGYPAGAFVIGLEYPREGRGWRPTLKLDLAVTMWMKGDEQVRDATLRALNELGLPSRVYSRFLRELGPSALSPDACEFHRFVGFGFEPDGSTHLDVYFEPSRPPRGSRKSATAATGTVARAIGMASRFLDESQGADGAWSDFRLPVGESDAWVTAYVLRQLCYLRGPDALGPCRHRAMRFLLLRRRDGGGWGYSSATQGDSDSTSLAILALGAMGVEVPGESIGRLRRHLRADGGVATYLEGEGLEGAWTKSHCDVTPSALLALEQALHGSERDRALEFLRTAQRRDGLWPSYWWVTPLYATHACLAWFSRQARPVPRSQSLARTLGRFRPYGAFETALRASCLVELSCGGARLRSDVRRLVASQLPDGSWPSSSFLRLSDPSVETPWREIDSGAIYRDQNRVFTTATVLGCLAGVERTARREAGPVSIRALHD